METVIIIGGVFHLAYGIFHIFFWRLFDWKNDLKSLSSINRNVMQILNLCLTVVFFIFAYVSFFHTQEMLNTGLGQVLLWSIVILWWLRALEQIIFFGLKNPLSLGLFVSFVVVGGLYLVPLV